MTYTQIERCRICGNQDLAPIIDLGTQTLTGVFPQRRDQAITSGSIGRVTLTREALPTELLRLATSPPVVIGLVLYSVGFLAWLGAMSRFGLGYVYPFTSLNVVVLLCSWLIFKEPLSPAARA